MLLEMEDDELIFHINQTDSLSRKIDEASNVLKRHQTQGKGPGQQGPGQPRKN